MLHLVLLRDSYYFLYGGIDPVDLRNGREYSGKECRGDGEQTP